MKIVLDTNVFISGIFWKGSPHTILKLWATDKIQILITEKILDEYIRILQKIDQKQNVAPKWAAFAAENSIILKDRNIIKICRDPEDNKFLNCAVMGRADYIVSGDDDLLCLKKIGSIQILAPAQFLKVF